MKTLDGIFAEIVFKALFMVFWLYVINKFVMPLDLNGALLLVLGYIIGTLIINGIRIKTWYDTKRSLK